MSTGIRCRNTSCDHVFDKATLRGKESIQCPKCGRTHRLRYSPASSNSAKPPASPVPTADIPNAAPIEPAIETPELPETASSSEQNSTNEALIKPPEHFSARRTSEAKSSGRRKIVIAVVVLALLGGVLGAVQLVGVKKLRDSMPWLQSLIPETQAPSGPAYVARDFNYKFVYPDKAWEKDEVLRARVKVNSLAMKRMQPKAWMAVAARDFKSNIPDENSLLEEAVRRLSEGFDDLEWENKGEMTIAGQAAQRIVFRAKFKDEPVSGECTFLVYQGIGYWLTSWTTVEEVEQTPERVASEFESLRNGFTFLQERDAPKQPRELRAFRGKKLPYQIRELPGAWTEWSNPESEDEQADLLLIGNDPEEPKQVALQANVMVLMLPAKGDLKAAAAAARAHVESQHKKTFPDTTTELINDKDGPIDRDQPVGNQDGHVLKLQARNGETRERFIVLAVVEPAGIEQALVIQCECDWKRRSTWERVFDQLIRKLSIDRNPPDAGEVQK